MREHTKAKNGEKRCPVRKNGKRNSKEDFIKGLTPNRKLNRDLPKMKHRKMKKRVKVLSVNMQYAGMTCCV